MLINELITELAGLAVGGVHQDVLPRGYTLPAIVIHQYNGGKDYDFDGPLELSESQFQIDAYGNTQAERDIVRASVESKMDGLTGGLTGGSVVLVCKRERGPQDLPYMDSLTKAGKGFRAVLVYRLLTV